MASLQFLLTKAMNEDNGSNNTWLRFFLKSLEERLKQLENLEFKIGKMEQKIDKIDNDLTKLYHKENLKLNGKFVIFAAIIAAIATIVAEFLKRS